MAGAEGCGDALGDYLHIMIFYNAMVVTAAVAFFTFLILMCVYLSEMGYYRNEESKNDCRSGYLILSADSLQVYHGMVCENDKGYEQYLPQKQSSKIFTFRRSGYIPQYVLEELDKGNVVSVASLGKRKYIVQSFSR